MPPSTIKSKRRGLVDTVIGHAVDHYLDRPGVYFWKSTISNKAKSMPEIRDFIKECGAVAKLKRLGVGKLINNYIDCRVRSELGRKDEHGVRIFESYQGGEEERRFAVFDSFTYDQVISARDHCKAGAKTMIRKTDVYNLILDLMKKHGVRCTVGDVREELNEMIVRLKRKA